MTVIDPTIAHPHVRLMPSVLSVAWVSVRAAGARGQSSVRDTLVLDIALVDPDRAIIEARVENAMGSRRLSGEGLDIPVRVRAYDGMLHVDATDDPALLGLTMALNHESARLMYVRTSLLKRFGFETGSCDAPVLRREDSRGGTFQAD